MNEGYMVLVPFVDLGIADLAPYHWAAPAPLGTKLGKFVGGHCPGFVQCEFTVLINNP